MEWEETIPFASVRSAMLAVLSLGSCFYKVDIPAKWGTEVD